MRRNPFKKIQFSRLDFILLSVPIMIFSSFLFYSN